MSLPLLHIAGGVMAVAAGFAALYSGKGGTLHRRSGAIWHVWRMCAALFIAAASFFLGPVRRIPVPLRAPAFRLIPLLVLVTMTFWLWRFRRGRDRPHVVAGGVPEAV